MPSCRWPPGATKHQHARTTTLLCRSRAEPIGNGGGVTSTGRSNPGPYIFPRPVARPSFLLHSTEHGNDGRASHRSRRQGLTFRRNFAEISVFFSFPLVTGIRNFGIFRYISFQNSKFNKFRPKSTEIRRNSPKFRNGIPFPLNTGI